MRGNNTKKKKKNVEYIYIEERTFTVFTAPSGNKYIQAKFGNKPDGKPLVKKITAPTRQELEQAIKDYMAELDGKSGGNITYHNACLEYIKTKSMLADSTLINYRNMANNRFKSLHNKPIMQLTKQDVFNAINEDVEKNHLTKSTLSSAVVFLIMICTEYEIPAMTLKLKRDITRYVTPATKLNKSRKSREDWDNAPSAMDVARWAGQNTRPDRVKTAISILLDLHSLRSEETRGLQYRDVYEQDGKCYMYIHATRTCMNGKDFYRDTTKNEGSTRKILIDRRLYDMIHAQEHSSDTDFVIDLTRGTYADRIGKAIQGHGADWITPHVLRHIYKTENIGNPIARAVGGWAAEGGVSEKVYTHIKQKDMDEFMTEYSAKLLDSYDGITKAVITVNSKVG